MAASCIDSSQDSEDARGLDALDVRVIRDDAPRFSKSFTICTLVVNVERYQTMLSSFRARGFSDKNSEFIAFDNTQGNIADGYTWLRRALIESRGKYVVFCHDDVELLSDGYAELMGCLERLDAQDDRWVMAGNAGHERTWLRTYSSSLRAHLQMPDFRLFEGVVPCRVESLDENFFVVRRTNAVLGSLDLDGFHFYASDLALMTEIAGGRSYVIPFELLHKSFGNYDENFSVGRRALARKYRKYFPGRKYIATTGAFRFGAIGVLESMLAPIGSPTQSPLVKPELVHSEMSLWRRATRRMKRTLNRSR